MTGSLTERFVDVFDEIGRGAIEREQERTLPFREVDLLREAGFTSVTVPTEYGGGGASHTEFFELLAELARRDPNVAHLFRSHFSFVDRTVHTAPEAVRAERLGRVIDGEIVGNASHERSRASVGSLSTQVTRVDGRTLLNGTKYYSTGALFADQIAVGAEDDGDPVGVLVPARAAGVTRVDDWAGFGQRLTGSGTTIFENVEIDESLITRRGGSGPSHSSAFVQLVLLAVAAGIGRSIVDDATAYVRARTRAYSHGSAATVQQDPLVLEVVGDLSALSFAADSALAAASTRLAESGRAQLSGAGHEEVAARVATAERATTHAQLTVFRSVLDAATQLFEVGGASAIDVARGFDRHWRNARTLASHNPARYKARAVGDLLVNGESLVGWWSAGEASTPTKSSSGAAEHDEENAS